MMNRIEAIAALHALRWGLWSAEAPRLVSKLSAAERNDLAAEALLIRAKRDKRAQARAFERETVYRDNEGFEERFTHNTRPSFDDIERAESSGIAVSEKQRKSARSHKERADRAQAESDARIEESWGRVRESFKAYEDSVRQQVVLELTEELLGTEFSLPDGRMVTWGTATCEEHAARICQLEASVTGTIETATLHRAAITMLSQAHVSTLREVEA